MAKRQPRRREEESACPQLAKERKTLSGALLQLPVPSAAELVQIQLLSNREALVDGCKGVLEYNERCVRLNLGSMTVRLSGRGLQLRSMSEESILIDGFIQSVEYIL